MSNDLRFRLLLDLISNVGQRSQQEARLVEDAQRRMADAAMRTNDRTSRLERTLSELSAHSGLERQVGYMQRLGSAIDQAHERLGRLKQALATGLDKLPEVAAVAGAAGYAGSRVALPPLRAFASLEDAVTELRIAMLDKSGKVSPVFGAVQAEAVRLGNQLPGSTKDFVQAAIALKQQGVPDRVMVQALRGAGGFGVLMGMGQYESAETIAKMREAYGLRDDQVVPMADLLQRARFAFGINPTDFRTSAQYAAPTYNTMGLTGLENARKLLAVQGIAASVGLESSSFGTNFADMLSRLSQVDRRIGGKSKEAKEVAAVLAKHGIELSFYGADKKFLGIENMLAQLAKLRVLADLDKQHVLTKIFEVQGGRPAQILVDKGVEEYRSALQRIDNQASLEQRLQLKTETLTSVLDALTGSFENLLASMGGPTGRGIKPAINKANDWLGGLTDWAGDHPATSTALLVGGTLGAAALGVRFARPLTGLLGRGAAAPAAESLVWPTLPGAAPAAGSFAGGIARSTGLSSLITLPLAGIDAWSIAQNDSLTDAGKSREYWRLGMTTGSSLVGGTLGRMAGGALLGKWLGPWGALGGMVLGGLAGQVGAGELFDTFNPLNPGRDLVSVTAPVSGAGAAPGQTATVQIGSGELRLDVRVTDERVDVVPSVTRGLPLLRIDAGSTDPGSFASGSGRGY